MDTVISDACKTVSTHLPLASITAQLMSEDLLRAYSNFLFWTGRRDLITPATDHTHPFTQSSRLSVNRTVNTLSYGQPLIASNEAHVALYWKKHAQILYSHLVSAVIYRTADRWLRVCRPYRKISSRIIQVIG